MNADEVEGVQTTRTEEAVAPPDRASRDYANLTEWLARLRRRWRRAMCLAGLFKLTGGVAAAALVLFAVDNLLRLPAGVRLVGLAAGVSVLAAAVYRYLFRPALQPLGDECVAAHAERVIPGLDNRAINAVQLHRELMSPAARKLADVQLREAAQKMTDTPVRNPRDWRYARRCAGLMLIGLLPFLAYAFLLPGALGNAWVRFSRPWRPTPPLSSTKLEVHPGDASVLAGELILVEAIPGGQIPDSAKITFWREDTGEREVQPMSFEGGAFVFQFAALLRSVRYYVEAGDAVSIKYRVEVLPRPFVNSIGIAYRYPGYLGLEPEEVKDAAGDVAAVAGSRVVLTVTADCPISSGAWRFRPEAQESPDAAGEDAVPEEHEMELEGERSARFEFLLTRSGTYSIEVRDKRGVPSPPVAHAVLATPDNAPQCSVLSPGRDVTRTPGAQVPIHVKATDDYGVRRLALLLSTDGKTFQPLDTRRFEPGTKSITEAFSIDLSALGAVEGQIVAYCALAEDGLDREDESAGRSIVYRITVASQKQVASAGAEDVESIQTGIRRILKNQRLAHATASFVSKWASTASENIARQAGDGYAKKMDALVQEQGSVREETVRLVRRHDTHTGAETGNEEKVKMLAVLRAMADGEMDAALSASAGLRDCPDNESVVKKATPLLALQKSIIDKLQALLGGREDAIDSLLAAESESEKASDKESAREMAENLLDKLGEFAKEQKETIAATKALDKKAVDDFTEGDLKAIEDARETESKWAKFFEEKATDFSKLAPQDFADNSTAKELLEIWSEVQKAEDALTRKNVETAVPLEQSGLELAEELTTNLEKWLMDAKDSIKWSMEEPVQDYDVPIVDLPDELEDLIGDLLDSEESMTDEVEDVTSSWMDSLDKGAGWGTMDGPISNMSAQGKTGNLLPNTNEVGGRSGEGRSGKSSGQFVEETATGKGGRDTPTRLTPDPYEDGQVQDTSTDPVTGSTGGGRASGWGKDGLSGPAPPEVAEKLARLAQKQADIVNKAQKLDHGLKVYRYPRAGLPEAIDQMKQAQQDMEAQRYRDYSRTQKVIIANLREVKDAVERQKKINKDTAAGLPKQLREEIMSSLSDKSPREYRESLSEYYKRLAGGSE